MKKKIDKDELYFEKELEHLFIEDQRDRTNKLYLQNEELFNNREMQRERAARKIYKEFITGAIILTPKATRYLALIFHHQCSSEDYKIAHQLAKQAADQGEKQARWLQAAAEDRYLISIGKNQKWGTQFQKNTADEWEYVAPVNKGWVTDEERTKMNVPILAEQLSKINNVSN